MSPTGNEGDGGVELKKSLSLVETLVAVAVLSIGIVVVCEGFLVSLGGFQYSVDYLNVLLWMDWKLWDLHDKLIHYHVLPAADESGTFYMDNKLCNWDLSYHLIEGTDTISLYEFTVRVIWNEGLRKAQTQRTVHALLVQE